MHGKTGVAHPLRAYDGRPAAWEPPLLSSFALAGVCNPGSLKMHGKTGVAHPLRAQDNSPAGWEPPLLIAGSPTLSGVAHPPESVRGRLVVVYVAILANVHGQADDGQH